MSTPAYEITTDSELQTAVRAETGYEDTPDQLSSITLDDLIANAKLTLATKADLDPGDWYSDRGMGLALLGVTCVKAKSRVENFSVTSWSLGGGDVSIDTDGSGERDVQIEQYESMIQTGMVASDVGSASASMPTNINSSSYVG